MRGLFRSSAVQLSAIFLISSVVAYQEGQSLWGQYQTAQGNLQSSRSRFAQLDSELAGMKRLIATVPKSEARSAQPLHERMAVLVQAIRSAEPQTRVVLQTVSADGSSGGDRHGVSQFFQPLPGLPEAATARINVEGGYLTRSGLEEFLAAGRATGASLTSLNVVDRRFKAAFTLYGRI